MTFDASASASEDFVFVCPTRLDCVLAAADASELAELRLWCEQLPANSYGQVFIVGETGEQLAAAARLSTPTGVAVTLLSCEANGEKRSEAVLAEAVDAWLDEWVRVDYESERHVQIWAGARSTPVMRDFWHRLETELTAA